jgi:hypothetical protein
MILRFRSHLAKAPARQTVLFGELDAAMNDWESDVVSLGNAVSTLKPQG